MYIRMVPEKDIHITNHDGSDYCVFEKGVPIWIWDDRGGNSRAWGRFRRMVFERDDYTCQKCGSKEKKVLRVHHKKPVSKFPNLYYDIDNTTTLCDECHRHIPKMVSSMKIRGGKIT